MAVTIIPSANQCDNLARSCFNILSTYCYQKSFTTKNMIRRRMYHSNIHDLFYSLIYGGISALEIYMNNGGSLQILGPDRKSLLIGCIEEKQTAIFDRCLELGMDVDGVDDQGMTPLHKSALLGMKDCVLSLLSHGAQVDVRDKHGSTALMLATLGRHKDIFRLLLESNCNLNITDEDGFTALHHASKLMSVEMVEILLRKGADFTILASARVTAMNLAVHNKDTKVVEAILQQSGRFNESSTMFTSELLQAVNRKYWDGVIMFLAHGVDPFSDRSEDLLSWTEVLVNSGCRRIRTTLISEYGYFTLCGPENKLLVNIFKNHSMLLYFGTFKLMFLYGLQIHALFDVNNCVKEKCLCGKVTKDAQSISGNPLPLSLQLLSRTYIRRSLGLGVVKKARTLPIPDRMKRYICLSGEYCLEKSLI